MESCVFSSSCDANEFYVTPSVKVGEYKYRFYTHILFVIKTNQNIDSYRFFSSFSELLKQNSELRKSLKCAKEFFSSQKTNSNIYFLSFEILHSLLMPITHGYLIPLLFLQMLAFMMKSYVYMSRHSWLLHFQTQIVFNHCIFTSNIERFFFGIILAYLYGINVCGGHVQTHE